MRACAEVCNVRLAVVQNARISDNDNQSSAAQKEDFGAQHRAGVVQNR
jgi:hypothetical protein